MTTALIRIHPAREERTPRLRAASAGDRALLGLDADAPCVVAVSCGEIVGHAIARGTLRGASSADASSDAMRSSRLSDGLRLALRHARLGQSVRHALRRARLDAATTEDHASLAPSTTHAPSAPMQLDLFVAPTLRRRGLGTSLLGALLRELDERAVRAIEATVTTDRVDLVRFLAQSGFAAAWTHDDAEVAATARSIRFSRVVGEWGLARLALPSPMPFAPVLRVPGASSSSPLRFDAARASSDIRTVIVPA